MGIRNPLKDEARKRGDKTYMPQFACTRGHMALRRVDNGSCTVCLTEASRRSARKNVALINERRRKHRAENPELYAQKRQTTGYINNVIRQIKRRTELGISAHSRMKDRLFSLKRLVGWDEELTEFASQEAHHLARQRDKCTGIKWSVDHIVPINGKVVSGLHVWNNLQVIPLQQNRLKHNRLEI